MTITQVDTWKCLHSNNQVTNFGFKNSFVLKHNYKILNIIKKRSCKQIEEPCDFPMTAKTRIKKEIKRNLSRNISH